MNRETNERVGSELGDFVRLWLRGAPVYVRLDPERWPWGPRPGTVEVRYRPSLDARVYTAGLRNLTADDEEGRCLLDELRRKRAEERSERRTPKKPAQKGTVPKPSLVVPPGVVAVHVHASSSGGHASIGVVIVDGEERVEVSDTVGEGTINRAELLGIERALCELAKEQAGRPVWIHSSSQYALGVCSGKLRARENLDLMEDLRGAMRRFRSLRWVWLAKKQRYAENERARELARQALSPSSPSLLPATASSGLHP